MRLLQIGVKVWWVLCLCLFGPAALAAAVLDLSGDERAWILRNSSIEVVVIDGHQPYLQRLSDGSAAGFTIDMMNLIAERTGLRWTYRWAASPLEVQQLFQSGQARLTPMAAASPERKKLVSFPGVLLPSELVLVSRTNVPDVSAAQDFSNRRIAVVPGYLPGDLLRREHPNARFENYNSLAEAMKAVSTGQADLCIAWLHEAIYQIEANLLANLRVRREDSAARNFLGPAVARREVVLNGILQKALDSISPAERAAVAARWLPLGTLVIWAPGQAQLSDAERDWVQRSGDVRVGFDRDFAPFTSSPGLGRFEGLGADMFRLAAQKVGLRVVAQTGSSFADIFARAAKGEIDVVVGMARTEARRAQFDFVGPFSSSPTVLVMRSNDARLWRSPDDIEGAPLALLADHFLAPQLRSRLPGVVLAEFDTQDQALSAVSDGRADAAIGNATVINRLIDAHFAGQLRLTGVVADGDSELYFGVPSSKPELTRLLAKGFAAITPGEAADIRRRWLYVTVQSGLSWAKVLRWGVPVTLVALLVIGVLWLANRRLKTAYRREGTARREAEAATQARQQSEALLSDIAASVPGVVFRYLVRPDGSIAHRYTSPGTPHFLGLDRVSPNRSILREVIEHLRTDFRAPTLAAEQASLRTGQPFKVTVAYLNPVIGEQWLHTEAVQRTQADGCRVWTGYIVDVSPERHLQARLAREAESRNLLLASASHELRAPTHALSIALQSVTGRGLAASEAGALEVVRQSALSLTQLLNDVLDAARYSTEAIKLRPRNFDLHTLVAEVAGAWRAAAGSKGLGFDISMGAGLPRSVVLDPLRLKQILTNLLSNACKYTATGRVWLEVSLDASGGLLCVVGDTGVGIAAGDQAGLFAPFTTASGPVQRSAPEGSSGLGLAICRQLASLMGGRIELDSVLGQGTRISVHIPLAQDAVVPPAGSRHGKVLVCDDDQVSRLIMTEMLRRSGFEAVEAGDGQQALFIWRGGGVAALVTDLDMPGMSGRELIQAVRLAEHGQAQATLIVVCSGAEASPLQPAGAPVLPCDAYLLKPVQISELTQTLRALGLGQA